jgi:hypothetical protein
MDARALLAKWESELAAIDARRSELLVGISMARRELGLSDEPPARITGTRDQLLPPGRDREDGSHRPYLGMNILDAAKIYLTKTREPKSPLEIADAIRQGGVHSRSDDFPGVVRTTLSRKGKDVGVESFGNTLWGLKEWRPGRARTEQGGDEGEN